MLGKFIWFGLKAQTSKMLETNLSNRLSLFCCHCAWCYQPLFWDSWACASQIFSVVLQSERRSGSVAWNKLSSKLNVTLSQPYRPNNFTPSHTLQWPTSTERWLSLSSKTLLPSSSLSGIDLHLKWFVFIGVVCPVQIGRKKLMKWQPKLRSWLIPLDNLWTQKPVSPTGLELLCFFNMQTGCWTPSVILICSLGSSNMIICASVPHTYSLWGSTDSGISLIRVDLSRLSLYRIVRMLFLTIRCSTEETKVSLNSLFKSHEFLGTQASLLFCALLNLYCI